MEDEEDPAEKTVNDKLLKEFVPSLVTAILARRSVPPRCPFSPFGSPCFIASDLIPISSALRSDLSPQDIFKANHVLQKVLELHSGFRDHDIPHLLQAVINILTDPHKPFYVRLPSRPFPFSLVRLFFLFSPALFLFGYRRSRALG